MLMEMVGTSGPMKGENPDIWFRMLTFVFVRVLFLRLLLRIKLSFSVSCGSLSTLSSLTGSCDCPGDWCPLWLWLLLGTEG
jgi:hypothetical protein